MFEIRFVAGDLGFDATALGYWKVGPVNFAAVVEVETEQKDYAAPGSVTGDFRQAVVVPTSFLEVCSLTGFGVVDAAFVESTVALAAGVEFALVEIVVLEVDH